MSGAETARCRVVQRRIGGAESAAPKRRRRNGPPPPFGRQARAVGAVAEVKSSTPIFLNVFMVTNRI